MRILVGADAAGFSLKAELIAYLRRGGHEVEDAGTYSTEPVHYPEYARKVGRAVARKKHDCGILICGTGIGMSIAANKVPGVRAALVHDSFGARLSREHNDANVLVMGAWEVTPERAKEIVTSWLTAGYKGGRHDTRLRQLAALDRYIEEESADIQQEGEAAC